MRKCPKCGEWLRYGEYTTHEKLCRSVSMADIDTATIDKRVIIEEPTKTVFKPGYECELCGEVQYYEFLKNYTLPICEKCKSALRKLIKKI